MEQVDGSYPLTMGSQGKTRKTNHMIIVSLKLGRYDFVLQTRPYTAGTSLLAYTLRDCNNYTVALHCLELVASLSPNKAPEPAKEEPTTRL